MSGKPKTRLVSKGRYLCVMSTRTTLTAAYIFCGILGAAALVKSALLFLFEGGRGFDFACGGAYMFYLSISFYQQTLRIERVAPITHRNTHRLPPEESLVRPSELPPSQQQAELLRAAPFGRETPPAELLRATQGEGRDV